jgi:small subunit ribosomal protein S17
MSANQSNAGEVRRQRKVVRGQVTSNKMQKTLVVEVHRKVRHPLYEKFVSKSTKLYAHDENNEGRIGDIVEVMQTLSLIHI